MRHIWLRYTDLRPQVSKGPQRGHHHRHDGVSSRRHCGVVLRRSRGHPDRDSSVNRHRNVWDRDGYHRLLTHRGYRPTDGSEYVLTWCHACARRRTHLLGRDAPHPSSAFRSDGDPIRRARAHGGRTPAGSSAAQGCTTTRLCSLVTCLILVRDRGQVWLSKWHWTSNVFVGLGLLAFGGVPYVLWGIFLRTVVGLHATWLVNSATHKWGSRRFATRDDSTNNWWVALLTFGEGWHNNDHAHPTSARHGLAWYEVDVNWIGIRTLAALGLAWDIKTARISNH